MVFDAILETYQLGTDMTERTANQALATWAETEYETKQAWAKITLEGRWAVKVVNLK